MSLFDTIDFASSVSQLGAGSHAGTGAGPRIISEEHDRSKISWQNGQFDIHEMNGQTGVAAGLRRANLGMTNGRINMMSAALPMAFAGGRDRPQRHPRGNAAAGLTGRMEPTEDTALHRLPGQANFGQFVLHCPWRQRRRDRRRRRLEVYHIHQRADERTG